MKIAVDARELCGRSTGVGRYLSELLTEWAHGPELHRHEWLLYAHQPPAVPEAFADRVRIIAGAGGTRWEQWDLTRALRADRPDILFAPAYTAPLTAPCPIALTIHDVSFFARPDEFRRREGFRRRRVTTLAARRAHIVLTVSAFSAQEIRRWIGIPESRIRVIHHGMRAGPVGAAPAALRAPIVLYVGSLFPRRHVDLLVSTFARAVAPRLPNARLEIIGDNRLPPGVSIDSWLGGVPAEIATRVKFHSWVDEPTLSDLYSRAMAFAFLSDYEGFGLTPLEALAAGVPPVVLDTPVAREIYGPAARFLAGGLSPSTERGQSPSNDVRTTVDASADLAEALVSLLTQEATRHEVLRHAPEVLARYRWDVAAQKTLAAITEAAGG